jgi:hypothetical protein
MNFEGTEGHGIATKYRAVMHIVRNHPKHQMDGAAMKMVIPGLDLGSTHEILEILGSGCRLSTLIFPAW